MCCPGGGALVHQNSLKTRLKSLKNRLQIKTLNGVTRATGGRSLIGLRRVAFGGSPHRGARRETERHSFLTNERECTPYLF